MNNLATALGKNFIKNKEAVRIRSFELGGHTFKVKVPLTAEFELMQERMKEMPTDKIDKYYKDIIKDLEKYRTTKEPDIDVKFEANDVLVEGKSMREAAKNKLIAEQRITEMFKLLVPEEVGFDMNTITYEMIEELFPFPVQMQLIEEISKVISTGYEGGKGK